MARPTLPLTQKTRNHADRAKRPLAAPSGPLPESALKTPLRTCDLCVGAETEFIVPRTLFVVVQVILLCATALGGPVAAQATVSRTPEQLKALYDAHQGEFDYLLGDWEFTALSKQFGKSRGYWSAARVAEGAQVFDEFRVVGDSGETYYATSTLRAYNAVLDRWELISAEKGTGLQNVGTGNRVGAEMHLEQAFGVMKGAPSIWRIRYYNIQPNQFSWTADRSTDGGKTWVIDFSRIEAKRIGPPRSLGMLTPVKSAIVP